jgi:hypothetical protein
MNFKHMENTLKEEGHTVFNPIHIPDPDPTIENSDSLWVYYMKKAIPMLLEADCIYMLDGWETSKGARLEFSIATQLNISVRYAYEDQFYV